jgi:hypothetical protein
MVKRRRGPARDGEPSCVATRRTLPPRTCSLWGAVIEFFNHPAYGPVGILTGQLEGLICRTAALTLLERSQCKEAAADVDPDIKQARVLVVELVGGQPAAELRDQIAA